MIDALTYAVRDAIRGAGYGYSESTVEVMPDGKPKPNCGDIWISVHEGQERSTMDNALDEYFGYMVTLTMRATNVSWDRIGDQMYAKKLAKDVGFTRRCEKLRAFLHMNWYLLGLANTYICEYSDAVEVHGFCEPARYKGRSVVELCGGDWFTSDPDGEAVGLKSELRFEDARRLQPIATYV